MSKKKYPGVDEQALQSIARNFVSTAPIDQEQFVRSMEAKPVGLSVNDGNDSPRMQSSHVPEPVETTSQDSKAPLPPQAPIIEPANAPANDIHPIPPSLKDLENIPPRAKEVRSSKFPVFVSLLALIIASAPLIVPHVSPYLEKYQAPQWLGHGMEMVGGKQSLTALRTEAILDKLRADNATAESALLASIDDAVKRLSRLETSGSDLTATALRLDRIDEAVAQATNAQQQAESTTREFSTTLKNFEDGLQSSTKLSEERFLAIELAAREAARGVAQNQMTLGQELANLQKSLGKQEDMSLGLGEALLEIEKKTTKDRTELAQVAELASQNVVALKAARDEIQAKVDRLNDQLDKFGDALETAVALEIARSNSAISEAIERATLAGDMAREVEVKLSTFKENQIRVTRFSNVVARLGAAVLTSEPFMSEVKEAESVFVSVPEASAPLKSLATIASLGAPTQSKLRENFVTSVGPQLRDLGVKYDASLWSRAYMFLSGQDGPTTPEGQRVWEVVTAAETNLAEGDLGNAVIQVARFEGPANQIVNDWLAQARRRAAADKAFELLKTIASDLQTP